VEAAAARKEGGEGGGTGAGADDRGRDAVREAKKGILQRGRLFRRSDRTPPRAAGCSSPVGLGAGARLPVRGLSEWDGGSACVD